MKSLKDKPSPLVRPQSAMLGAKQPAWGDPPKGKHPAVKGVLRPWTAHPQQRGELSPQKVSRQSQHLRKSHLKAAVRKEPASAKRGQLALPPHAESPSASMECNAEGGVGLDVVTMISSVKSAGTDASVAEDASPGTQEDPGRPHRQPKRHPSFDAWVSGSPHDSDEYNTDLEEGEAASTEKQTSQQQSDASGVNIYEEQCRRHGFVPVSYLRRHLSRRTIKMRHRYLGGNATRPLAYAFRHNTVTETVDLSDNFLEASGAALLAAMLRENTFIVSLNLSNNFIGSHGCAALADMLDVNTTLKTLILAGNQLTDRDAQHFIDPLRNNMSLTCLDLSHNNLAEMAGLHLGAVLSGNDGLNDLDLSWNSIRKKGAVALVNALKVNTLLEVLDLSWNGIGAEGVSALQHSLQINTTLKVLDLTNNRIDTKAASKLAVGLKKNFGLETLILNLNPMRDAGVEAILSATAVHPNLRFLSLENCGELGTSSDNLHRIQQLEKDKGLIILHGVAGGYQRNSSLWGMLRFFGRFCREHSTELETAFHQQDRDHSGILTEEETKQCLRIAGLRLTSRQLDLLIDEIDFSQIGRIQYRDILSGKVFAEYHKRRPSRRFDLSNGGKVSMGNALVT